MLLKQFILRTINYFKHMKVTYNKNFLITNKKRDFLNVIEFIESHENLAYTIKARSWESNYIIVYI